MNEYLRQMFGGPGTLRFFLQPAIALLLGIRDGCVDSRLGRRPYVLAVIMGSGHRANRIAQGLKAIVLPVCLAIAASLFFQYWIRKQVRLVPALVYATIFVALPYVIARALTNRVVTLLDGRHRTNGAAERPS